jgi:uncharacterized protein with NRDE domain
MCIVAVAWRAHPRWSLIAAANRDEYHGRPSEPLKPWDTEPVVIAGRDVVAGGTWLGITTDGRFAAVSNLRHRDSKLPTGRSRGQLVLDYLLTAALPADDEAELFNPFNMIAISAGRAAFLSNRPGPRGTNISSGIHAFSNGGFDDDWPKTRRLKEAISSRLGDESLASEQLFEFLFWDADREAGAAAVEESIFVRDAAYGTRCSTVVAIDHAGEGQIIERRFAPDARIVGETALTFSWPASSPSREHK